ncbi:tol-pal system YbgF family protein [Gracilinema caldarium]|uniref:tetratricopeptide repeat protein n=1 Tax=Gracilinema caldarium TaxID=215591 RepID=UPI0026E9A6FE|nr:tetratricopeptide repeat protein [Gracilinema caldarium]
MEKALGSALLVIGILLMNISCTSDIKGSYYVLQGTLQAKEKQSSQAISSFSQIAASSNAASRLYARYGLATVYYEMGEFRAAINLFENITQELSAHQSNTRGPEKELLYRALYNKGLCLYALENYDGAAETFRASLQVDGSRWNAKRNLELSLKAKTKKNSSAAAAGAVATKKQAAPNPVIFDYIRQKEIDRWKSQTGKGSEEESIDY